MASSITQLGSVLTFDEATGLGTVSDGSGTEWPFHCTQIADGSRTIAEGARVRFTVVAGHQGQWEASRIEPIG